MAVLHRCWKVNVTAARRALAGLTNLEDLLSPAVTTRVREVGEDPQYSSLLVMARLDPRDRESWAEDLEPSSEDFGFERSGATRLTVLLASVSSEAGSVSTPPQFVETHLRAAEWSGERIELCLRGKRISGLFEQLSPGLSAAVAQCREWLVGGWLDLAAARDCKEELAASKAALDRTRDELARNLSTRTGLRPGEIDALLRQGVADVGAMLTQVDAENVLWIIQD